MSITQLTLLDVPQHTAIPSTRPDLSTYDLIVVGMSGKDAHAALDITAAEARAAGVFDRLLTIHADLGLIETPGVEFGGRYYPSNSELVAKQSAAYGIPTNRHITTRRIVEDGAGWREQTLLEHVAMWGRFPGPSTRWCTSDHKKSKIDAALTPLVRHLRPRLGRPVRILNVTGLRAEESCSRAQRATYSNKVANQARIVDDWLPAHHLNTADVWQIIERSGVPYHWAYDSVPGAGDHAGSSRLSCSLCIMGSRHDLLLAARRRPRLAALYAEVEQRRGHQFRLDMPISRLLDLAAQPGGPQPGVVLEENTVAFDEFAARVRAHLNRPVRLRASTEHTASTAGLGCACARMAAHS